MTLVDWREKCTPIRDQGQCGSCTAFGTIGAWEGLLKINGEEVDLSERDLFFCEGGTCSQGAEANQPLDQAKIGVCYEEYCPYGDTSGGADHACGDGLATHWKGRRIKSYKPLNGVDEIKAALDKGPVVTTMMCHQSFMVYMGGIYHSLGIWDPFVGGHMVALVGYDDVVGYWIGRNSWGPVGWGEGGYFRIVFGDSNIDDLAYALELKPGEIEGDSPGPGPEPPSDCPVARGIVAFLNAGYKLFGRKTRFRAIVPE